MAEQNKKIKTMTDSEFTALLRAKAENTPLPLSLEPQFILNRLPKKRSPTLWERLAPMACAAAACFAFVVTGDSGVNQYLYSSRDYLTAATAQEIAYYRDTGKMFGVDDEEFASEQNGTEEHLSPAPQTTNLMAGFIGKLVAPLPEPPVSEVTSDPGNEPTSEPTSDPISEPTSDPVSEPTSDLVSEPASEPSGDSESDVISDGASDDPASLPEENPDDPLAPEEASFDGEESENVTDPVIIPEEPQDLTYAQYYTPLLFGSKNGTGMRYSDKSDLMLLSGESGEGGKSVFTGRVSYFLRDLGGNGVILAVATQNGVVSSSTFVEYQLPTYDTMELSSVSCKELFLKGNTLAVAAEVTFADEDSTRTLSTVSLYDISAPLSPVYLNSYSQSGSYMGGRMQEEGFVLVTDHQPIGAAVGKPESYMPLRYYGSEKELLGDEIDWSQQKSIGCTVVSLFDREQFLDSRVLMGGGKDLYLGQSGVYLMKPGYRDTLISKYNVSGGQLEYIGETYVRGNCFTDLQSVSEYQGSLRLITGIDSDMVITVFDSSLERTAIHQEGIGDFFLTGIAYEGNIVYLTMNNAASSYAFCFDRLDKWMDACPSLERSYCFTADQAGYLAGGNVGDGSGFIRYGYGENGAIEPREELLVTVTPAEVSGLYSNGEYFGACFKEAEGWNYYLCRYNGEGQLECHTIVCGNNRVQYVYEESGRLHLISDHSARVVELATGNTLSANSY